jgi:hypothetical protein
VEANGGEPDDGDQREGVDGEEGCDKNGAPGGVRLGSGGDGVVGRVRQEADGDGAVVLGGRGGRLL